MNEMSVQQLPHGVVKLISSTQVISSVSSVVKELVENSIDAQATVIDIKLEKYGLDKIEVRDNGCGISSTDIHNVCLPNYTSKIYSFDDLEHLRSYGFRGEALNSLCAVSQVIITTRTQSDDIASTYTYDNNGTVRGVQPSHQMKGTIVTVTNLFKSVPVRRQFYENTRKGAEELKRIEKVVKLLSVIQPKLKITIAHNRCLIWQKTSVYTLRQSLMQVYPHVVQKNLVEFSTSFGEMSIEMLICKRDCNWSVLCQPLNEAILFFVNRRPVKDKKVDKLVLEEMTHMFASTLPANKCPLTLISIMLPTQDLDVNIEPDKSRVFIKNHEEVLKQIRECIMLHFYEQPLNTDKVQSEIPESEFAEDSNPRKRKMEDSDESKNEKKILYDKTNCPSPNTNSKEEFVPRSEIEEELADIDLSQFEETLNASEIVNSKTPSVESEPGNLQQPHNIATSDTCSPVPSQQSTVVGDISAELFESQPAADVDNINAPIVDIVSNNETETDNLLNDDLETEHLLNWISQEMKFSQNGISDERINSDELPTDNATVNTSVISNSEETDLPVSTDISRLSQTTLSQWSRGSAKIGVQPLQGGVSILCEKETKLKKNQNKGQISCKLPKSSTNVLDELPDTMERSVSSQMGRKDLAGLTNFARTVRTEIIKENPGISFTRVANELANRWRKLGDDQKNEYAERAKSAKNQKLRLPETKANIFIKKKKIIFDISIEEIVSNVNKPKIPELENDVRLIGALETKEHWLCRIGDFIAVLNTIRLQENVLYHRYLCHSSIPSRQLDQSVKITQETIGSELWHFLLSLNRSQSLDSTYFIIPDCRIASNGFKIVVREESANRYDVAVIEVAEDLSFLCVENLKETLQLMTRHEELQHCRTSAIKRILWEDVVKACSENCLLSRKEIEMDLQYWVECMNQVPVGSMEKPVARLRRL